MILAKPQTYMNNSGDSLRSLVEYYKVAEFDLVYDKIYDIVFFVFLIVGELT